MVLSVVTQNYQYKRGRKTSFFYVRNTFTGH
jgi:hypothetical protein